MFNRKPIALAFALSAASVVGLVSATGLTPSASEMAMDAAKQQATDMTIEQDRAMAKDQLKSELMGDAAADAPNAAVSADEAAELAESGEDGEAEDE